MCAHPFEMGESTDGNLFVNGMYAGSGSIDESFEAMTSAYQPLMGGTTWNGESGGGMWSEGLRGMTLNPEYGVAWNMEMNQGKGYDGNLGLFSDSDPNEAILNAILGITSTPNNSGNQEACTTEQTCSEASNLNLGEISTCKSSLMNVQTSSDVSPAVINVMSAGVCSPGEILLATGSSDTSVMLSMRASEEGPSSVVSGQPTLPAEVVSSAATTLEDAEKTAAATTAEASASSTITVAPIIKKTWKTQLEKGHSLLNEACNLEIEWEKEGESLKLPNLVRWKILALSEELQLVAKEMSQTLITLRKVFRSLPVAMHMEICNDLPHSSRVRPEGPFKNRLSKALEVFTTLKGIQAQLDTLGGKLSCVAKAGQNITLEEFEAEMKSEKEAARSHKKKKAVKGKYTRHAPLNKMITLMSTTSESE